MSYTHRHTIAAADFNGLATSANSLWGTGTGDRGYGQGSLSSATARNPVGSAYASLRDTLAALCAWQNSSTTLLPSSYGVSARAAITAYPTGETPSFPDLLAVVDANRLNYQVGNMTLTSSAASTTRGSTWDTFIQAGFLIEFASEDGARHFFNTGGELRLACSHANTSSSQDTDWHNMLNDLNIAFRCHETAKLTGNGTGSSIGYYELTTDWQAVYSIPGSGAYSGNSFVVYAKADSITGTNGAKGSAIRLYCNFDDAHTNDFSDVVQPGTSTTLGHLRGTVAPLTNPIPAPTCSVAVAL